MTDERLLERARNGDRDAFAELVARHQDELYTMALRMLSDSADAADVVQETFMRAYVQLPKLRGATVRAWLYRVAINAAHDVQRRQVRRPTRALEDSEGRVIDLPDPAPGPEGRAEERERVGVVRDALAALSIEYRTVVVLRDVNDLSYEEISEALGVPLGTVKSRLNRGRGLLATVLRESPVLFPAVQEAP